MNWGKSLKYQSFLILGCLLAKSPWLLADENSVPDSRYTSARGAAMGGAYLPYADGGDALFYNPAGIAKTKEVSFDPMDFSVYGDSNYFSTINKNFYNVTSLSGFAPTLQSNQTSFIGSGFSLFPNYSMKYLSFGVLYQANQGAVANTDGSIQYKSLYQLIPTVGTGVSLAQGIVRIGYSLQWVNTASGDITVPGNSDPLGFNQQLNQGAGFSNNVGFALTLPISYLPAFNLVARNIGGLNYSGTSIISMARNSPGTPASEPMTIDSSLSFQPKIGAGSYANLSVEYRDITSQSLIPAPIIGKLALGAEISIRDALFLRAGFGTGYPSAGVGLKRKKSEFNLTWYTEDIGDGYHVQGDTRFLMQYKFNIF